MYIKCMSVTKFKCLIAMLNISKNENFKKFGPLIEYGPHWINFIIFTFISENKINFRGLYKIQNKIIIFYMRKKGKFKTYHKKNEEKSEFESLRSESLCFKGGTPIMLGPSTFILAFSNKMDVDATYRSNVTN